MFVFVAIFDAIIIKRYYYRYKFYEEYIVCYKIDDDVNCLCIYVFFFCCCFFGNLLNGSLLVGSRLLINVLFELFRLLLMFSFGKNSLLFLLGGVV